MLHRPCFHAEAVFTKKDAPSTERLLSIRPRTWAVTAPCWAIAAAQSIATEPIVTTLLAQMNLRSIKVPVELTSGPRLRA
jgi:hypothetical protein